VKHLVLAVFVGLFTVNSAIANEQSNSENPVVEIVVFKVTEPEAGIEAALALIEDATAFNNAIISSEIYQSASEKLLIFFWRSTAIQKLYPPGVSHLYFIIRITDCPEVCISQH